MAKGMWMGLGVWVLLAAAPGFALHPETSKNLEQAMQGEALASAKYQLYAEQARRNGHLEIARLFEEAAEVERSEHFAEQAQLKGLVGTEAENLRSAIQGENYEQSKMYPEFARQAEARGDIEAADRFREIARDEAKHRAQFKAALERLEGKQGGRARRGVPPR